jgi:sugar phosphate isomerase/epimerase
MRIGLQVIIFGHELLENLPIRLSMISENGFRVVEAGPMLLRWSPTDELAGLLADAGLQLCAFHCSTNRILETDALDQLCITLVKLKCDNITCSGILGGGDTLAHYERTGQLIKERTQVTSKFGIKLNYHHHDWELENTFGVRLGIQALTDQLDPSNGFVIDTYWATAAGIEFEWLWEQYSDRCHMIHLKDGFPKIRRFRALGEGEVDVGKAFAFFRDKVEYIIWEQDLAEDRDSEECISISSTWLQERMQADGKE